MTKTDYLAFLVSKRIVAPSVGFTVATESLPAPLFPFQRAIVHWALRKGRAAIFADTGLGKTLMSLSWAHRVAEHAGGPVLMLAPLAVARQTVAEGERWGLPVTYVTDRAQVTPGPGVWVTNYERLARFDGLGEAGVVLDGSSILKAFSGVTKRALVARFRQTTYRLCCTATPAPNDVVELCNHADFLGVMSPSDMISTFFLSVGGQRHGAVGQEKFRLKRHARQDFFRWLASWAMAVRRPSDLGFSDEGYTLPELSIRPVIVPTDWVPTGQLFPTVLKCVTQRAEVRRATVAGRVEAAARLVEAEPGECWLLWCGLNDEARMLASAVPGAVNVEGSDDPETKAAALLAFADGQTRVLVTKPAIAGFGLNLQRCARMAFVGIGDSYETYYQSVRRCWRFGQTRPVHAYVIVSEPEAAIYDNVLRKEREAAELSAELVAHVAAYEREELAGVQGDGDAYQPVRPIVVPDWLRSEDAA